jgi:hypothetical protein
VDRLRQDVREVESSGIVLTISFEEFTNFIRGHYTILSRGRDVFINAHPYFYELYDRTLTSFREALSLQIVTDNLHRDSSVASRL